VVRVLREREKESARARAKRERERERERETVRVHFALKKTKFSVEFVGSSSTWLRVEG